MTYFPNGLSPIGAILAWAKSLTGTPTLTSEYVECNGQTLNDTASPYNGLVMPNLNSAGQNRFLRGSSTSGGTGGAATHVHALCAGTSLCETGTGSYSICTTAVNNEPPYYNVVWVIHIK